MPSGSQSRYLLVAVLLLVFSLMYSAQIASAQEFTVEVDTVEGRRGETVEIPIYFRNVPEAEINNFDFRTYFDSDVVEVEEIKAGDIIPNPTENLATNIDNDREFSSYVFTDKTGFKEAEEQITESGEALILVVNISSDAPEEFTEVFVDEIGAFGDKDLNRLDVSSEDGGVDIIVDDEEPDPPELSLSQEDDGKVELEWTAVGEASEYVINYGQSSEEYDEDVITAEDTSVTVDGLENGTTYYFAVQAIIDEETETELSNEISATPRSADETPDVSLRLTEYISAPENDFVRFESWIFNEGESVIDLSNLEMRYYYTLEDDFDQVYATDHAAIVGPDVYNQVKGIHGEFVSLSEEREDANMYLEITFDKQNVKPGQKIRSFNRFYSANGELYDQTNDYSFGDPEKIVLYYNDEIIWGTEPEEISSGEPPAVPAGISVSGAGDDAVEVSWNESEGAEDYVVNYGESEDQLDEEEITEETSLVIEDLVPGTYYFSVAARNEHGNSDSSDIESHTLSGPPQGDEVVIEVGTVEDVEPGDQVEVPVYFSEVPEAEINNFDFRTYFDSDVVEVEEIKAGDIIPNPTENLATNIDNDREFSSYVFTDKTGFEEAEEQITESGEALILVVNVSSSAPEGLSEIVVDEIGAFGDKELNRLDVSSEDGGIIVG
ncbi:MAG: cohesin domain-containing protein, partial [Halanaerobiales bacterium]